MIDISHTDKPATWPGDLAIYVYGDVPLAEISAQLAKANRIVGILSTLLENSSSNVVGAHELNLSGDDTAKVFIDITTWVDDDDEDNESDQHQVTIQVRVYLDALDELEGLIGTSVSERNSVS